LSDSQARLDAAAREALERVLALIAADPRSLSAVRDPERGWDIHVADALAGLEVEELVSARRIADLGAGAGFPGLPLATALPQARVDLIESVRRKADFICEASAAAGIENARAIAARSEEWARERPPVGGREAYDAAVARAVGSLEALAELAAPLLRKGGVLVAWKGRRDPGEEHDLAASAPGFAMAPERVLAVRPYEASRYRHLHVVRKVGPTPEGLPRRPGVSAKRARSRARRAG
jgi:16S rRNA (guanine527-N7)-methyltransferase